MYGFTQDEIRIEGLEVYAYHGVYPEETKKGQVFKVDATLYTDTHIAGATDELELSTDYGDVCHYIDRWMKKNTCKLLETVAERLARAILMHYPLVNALDLEIRKPEAPIVQPFHCVSVKISRGWHKVYLSVGSNMGDKEAYIRSALEGIKQEERIRNVKMSELLVTKPYGNVEQDDFLNGAIALETVMLPEELLDMLQRLEQNANRERLIHWGPRTLDVDILLYDDLVYENERLCIPHCDMKNREFVLKPLCEIAPNVKHPVYGKTVQELLEQL